jgi:tetratricopeptide (TPR) repeat protein
MTSKTERRALLAPDPFLAHKDDSTRWIRKNLVWVLLVVAAMFGSLVGFEWWQSTQLATAAQSTQRLRDATDLYRNVAYPPQMVQTETSTLTGKGALPPARAAFRAILESKEDASVRRIATLYAADLARRAEDQKEAESLYRGYLEDASKDDIFRFLALEGLGYALEAQARLDEAAEVFGQLAQSDLPNKNDGLNHQARILEKQGKPEEAKKLYRQLLERDPAPALKQNAEERLGDNEAS